MTVAAATSLAAETNQRPSREVRSSTPLLRTGLHSVHGHDTEPRKTCSRVGGICNSAIMKREFVQPCAGQNSEFTYHTWNSVLLAANLEDGSLFFVQGSICVLYYMASTYTLCYFLKISDRFECFLIA